MNAEQITLHNKRRKQQQQQQQQQQVLFSKVDLKRRACLHQTLVADLADDVSHICRDASLLDNKEEFNHNCTLFVGQAGDLGCFKCPSCANPYIAATRFQKHLNKCP